MNANPPSRPIPASRGAFTLVEVTLALGVAGFCLVTLFGLLPVGISSNQASLQQTMAANITSSILSDLNCTQPLVSATSAHFGISIPAAGSTRAPETIYLAADGSATGTVGSIPVRGGTSVSLYRATLWFTSPSASGQRTATAVRVLISWPALADATPGNLPANYTGSYEADTTLNRN